MKRIIFIVVLMILSSGLNAQSNNEIGSVVSVKGKDVLVKHRIPDKPLHAGQVIYVNNSDSKSVALKVVYPMMSSSKCVIIGVPSVSLQKGMKVYNDKSVIIRFVDNKNGTVTDNKSSLMWAKIISNDENTLGWKAGGNYARKVTVGGYSDWRVPSLSDIGTITDGFVPNTDWRIQIREFGFESIPDICWTSNYATTGNLSSGPRTKNAKRGLGVNLKEGMTGILDNDEQCCIWVVRGTAIVIDDDDPTTDVNEEADVNSGPVE